jgi:hypothetical protein
MLALRICYVVLFLPIVALLRAAFWILGGWLIAVSRPSRRRY